MNFYNKEIEVGNNLINLSLSSLQCVAQEFSYFWIKRKDNKKEIGHGGEFFHLKNFDIRDNEWKEN